MPSAFVLLAPSIALYLLFTVQTFLGDLYAIRLLSIFFAKSRVRVSEKRLFSTFSICPTFCWYELLTSNAFSFCPLWLLRSPYIYYSLCKPSSVTYTQSAFSRSFLLNRVFVSRKNDFSPRSQFVLLSVGMNR